LNNVQFIGNSAKGDGGGVLAYGTVSVTNGQFVSNATGNLGGGVVTYGVMQAVNSHFENNISANNWGGGVFANQSATLIGTDLISNTSMFAGGGLASYGSVSISGSRFERNLATTGGWGGGLYMAGPLLTISGTQFLSNTALATGGGTVGNTTFLTNTTYINNSAGSWGGGAEGFGPMQVFNSLFQNNRSQANGGGISSGSTVFVTNSQFINNKAQGDGTYGAGALAASLSVTTVNSLFTANTANTSPGGAVAVGQNLYLYATDFSGNTAVAGDGGAIFAYGSATIDQATFTANQSNARGGAAFISSTITISDSQFVNNFANSGGGLYHAAGDGRIVNSLFARNAASSNAGMALYLAPTGTLQVLFTTIAAPTLTSGEAVRITSGNVEIQDTIVTSHTTGLFRLGGTVFQDYNLLFGNTSPTFGVISGGTHNTNGDPKFLNPAADHYHIGLGSAAADAGVDVGVHTDIDGQSRPQGAGFDIGYDEMALFENPLFQIYLPVVIR
jgi:predicted outer membrane repeat protein